MSKEKLKIIITGSEGLLGSKISQFLEQNYRIMKLDLQLGDDLTNELFVKKWFLENHADCLVNCFAFNDHVDKNSKKSTLFDISLDSFSK